MSVSAAVWVNGTLSSPQEARVAALDHGITVGDGVFETLRLYRGAPFALRRHLDRLGRSAAGLGLPLPERSALERAVREVIGAAGLAEARLRLTLTAGPGPLGSGRTAGARTVIAAVSPLEPFPPTAQVVMVPWTRNERGALTGLKTTSYAENVVALAHAADRGGDEAIFANTRGELCEGTGSNVVVGLGGRLVTPPLSSGCLAGITRELILELVDVEEADLAPGDLAHADEAFLTSSTREVQPVGRVDGLGLQAAPGPMTRAAMAAFGALVAENLDP